MAARQRRTTDACLGIGTQNSPSGMFVISDVTFRLEAVRTSAVLADIRFVPYFPKTDPCMPLLVVFNQFKDQFVPLRVTDGLDNVLVDLRKKYAGFEANAHQRRSPRIENGFDRAVKRGKVVMM